MGRDAVVRAAGLGGEQIEVADVIAAASSGSRSRRPPWTTGAWLGIGLTNLVNLFNPEVVVLGGHLRLLLPLVAVRCSRQLHYALPAAREQVRVGVPSLQR